MVVKTISEANIRRNKDSNLYVATKVATYGSENHHY